MSVPMNEGSEIRVVLRGSEGYLAGNPQDLEFTDDLCQAAVFDFLADEIESELKLIRRAGGEVLEVIPVAQGDLAETCDRCQRTLAPRFAFFDGKQFLCPDCRYGRKPRPRFIQFSSNC